MYKSYFVPIIQEMTAIWSVWLCTHKQTLGAPCTKSKFLCANLQGTY